MKIDSGQLIKNILTYLDLAREEAKHHNPNATSIYLEDIKSVAYMISRPDLAFLADYIIKTIDDLNYLEILGKFRKSEEYRRTLEKTEFDDEEFKEFLTALITPPPEEFLAFIDSLVQSLDAMEKFIEKDEGFGEVIASLIDLMKVADRLKRLYGG